MLTLDCCSPKVTPLRNRGVARFTDKHGRAVEWRYDGKRGTILEDGRCVGSPKQRAKVGGLLSNLLFWLGPDRIIYGTDFPIWYPHWQLDEFMEFELPDDLKQEYGVDLTPAIKHKIIGGNIARLYELDVPTKLRMIENDEFAQRKREYASVAATQEPLGRGVAGAAPHDN